MCLLNSTTGGNRLPAETPKLFDLDRSYLSVSRVRVLFRGEVTPRRNRYVSDRLGFYVEVAFRLTKPN